MTERPQASDRQTAGRLARSIATDAGLRAFRLMSALHAPARPAAPPPPPRRDRIGLWVRALEGQRDVFRRGHHEPWRMWADVERLDAKNGRLRVVLLGESVARGYLYEPLYSPALVLESILRGCGLSSCEVLDLSRVSITARPLVELARAALALEPDAFVIFAGNNWHPFSPLQLTADDIEGLADAVRESGAWAAATPLVEQHLSRTVGALAAALGEVARRDGTSIPTLFLIPEFNLLDWRSNEPELPLLAPTPTAEWSHWRDCADRAWAAGNPNEARAAAQAMLALDGGTMATTFERLDTYGSSERSNAHRRSLLERARDAGLGLPRERLPCCSRVVQDALRHELPRHGIGVIDLPLAFDRHLEGELPGRNLFLDFCHMNADGIRVSMAHAAEWLLARLGSTRPPAVPALLMAAPRPTPETEAIAAVKAAFQNWRGRQPRDLQAHYCRTALDTHPIGEALLRDVIDYQTRAAPAAVCSGYQRLYEHAGPASRYYIPLAFAEADKGSRLELLDAASDALEARSPGAKHDLVAALQREHSVTARAIDLLEQYYQTTSDVSRELGGPVERAYYRAFERTSRFFFVCDRPVDLALAITWRLPDHPAQDDDLCLHVNDVCLTQLTAAPRWRTATIRVSASTVREGINALIVRWPPSAADWRAHVDRLVMGFDIGRSSTVYPAFGDLSTLRLSVAS